MGWHVPERPAGFGLGIIAAEPDILQDMVVKLRQAATFAANPDHPPQPEQRRRGLGVWAAGAGMGMGNHGQSPFTLVMFLGVCIIHVDTLRISVTFVKRMIVR
jgi:hypothetical protein